MSYQRERDHFVAQMTREELPYHVTEALLRAATGFNRRAELACSSEAADRDRVMCPKAAAERKYATAKIAKAVEMFGRYPCLCDSADDHVQHGRIPRITLQDWRTEQRLITLLADVNAKECELCAQGDSHVHGQWVLQTAGDPRGYTLRVIPPSYAERNTGKDRHNLDSIGVPSRPSRISW